MNKSKFRLFIRTSPITFICAKSFGVHRFPARIQRQACSILSAILEFPMEK